MNTNTFALFSSLFLGNRTAIKQDLEEQKPLFKVWGISHFLARSGLHLLIFIMLLQNRIKINPPLKTYILNSINNSIDKKCKLLLNPNDMNVAARPNENYWILGD
jgi:hypothetical protein